MTKKCKNCYWYSQCGQDKPCEYFDPLESNIEEERKAKEYEVALQERSSSYVKLVEEQQK